MSPPIHERLFGLSGIAAEYTLKEYSPEALKADPSEVLGLDGFNVTIPHKVEIIEYLDELAESAERYRSVNCVVRMNGRLIGHNTDCDGFLRSAKAAGAELGGRVLQFGCGGVGRMIAIECLRHGAELAVCVRNGSEASAEQVISYAEKNGLIDKVSVVHSDEIGGKFDLLVNATSVGMYPNTEHSPASEDIIRRCGFVYDVIYNPQQTKIMRIAEENGIKTCGGMAMLVWQAAVAHEIWDGSVYSADDIGQIINDMNRLMEVGK